MPTTKKSPFKGIVGPSYTYGSLPIDCQISMNFEPIRIESMNTKTEMALIGTPGAKHYQFRFNSTIYDEIPTNFPGRIRGLHYTSVGFFGNTNGALVVVAAESVYEVSPPDINNICDLRLIGTVSNLSGSVSMADDGFGLIIADNATLYRVELSSSSMGSLGSASPLQATSVTYLNGYTICAGKRAGVPANSFFWSGLYDNSTWNALDYASAEGSADPITSILAVGGDLWIMGPRSYEVWQNTGSVNLPFTRVSGSLGSIGSAASGAVSQIGETIFFLGSGATGNTKAYMSQGYNVVPISTDALEQEWARFSSFGDAIGYTYSQEGRTYWVVTWLTDNKTYVFSPEAQSWHQRATRDPSRDTYNRWKLTSAAYAYDKIFVGDLEGTRLYDLSSRYLDEDGNQIVRIRRAPHIFSGMQMVMHRSFTLDLETGMGTAIGQGVNPQIMLRYSSDGGRTYSSELWIPAGRQGEYKTRCKWSRLGIARDRVYQIYCSDPVQWAILGAELETEVSTAGI